MPGQKGKASIKVCSHDAETSATATLVRYDRGFKLDKTTAPVFSDSIVIEGDMSLDGEYCGRLCYW